MFAFACFVRGKKRAEVLLCLSHHLLILFCLLFSQLPLSIQHRTFTGCMGEAFLQGKSIGLWNFKNITNRSDCGGCVKR